ncbi:hypothetical protein B0H13DRAFT_2680922 [Mycena leptocephala]|nr:hypothetical protein B0H13DRAFT_2680922 [Mycena leptocephala]
MRVLLHLLLPDSPAHPRQHGARARRLQSHGAPPPPRPVPARIRTMSQRASTRVDTNAAAVGLFDAQVLQVQVCPYLLVFI